MDQIKYQGYARDRGFNPVQFSTGRVDAIAQQGASMLRQLRDNQRAEIGNRDAFLQATQRAQALERENRAANYEFARSSRKSYQEAALRNQERLVNDAQRAQQNFEPELTALAQLSKFSETISKSLVEYQKQREEDQYNQEIVNSMLGGNAQEAAAVEDAYQQLRTGGQQIQGLADRLEDGGMPEELVQSVRQQSRTSPVISARAAAAMAPADYFSWLEERFSNDDQNRITVMTPTGPQEISPMNHSGSAQREAVMRALLPMFLKEKGLYGMKASFLAPALLEMRKTELNFLNQEARAFSVAQNKQRADEANVLFETEVQTNPTQAWTNFLEGMKGVKDGDGVRLGYGGAFQKAMERLRDLGDVSAVEAIRDSPHPIVKGKTWGQVRGDDFNDVLEEIENDALSRDRNQEARFQMEGNKIARDIIAEWDKNPPSEADAEAVIKAHTAKYGPNSDLQNWASKYTVEAIDEAATRKNLDELIRQGIPIPPQDLIGLPKEIQDSYRGYVQKTDDAMKGGGGDAAMNYIKEKIEARAQWSAAKGNPKDPSIGLAVAAAQRELQQLIAKNLAGGQSPTEAVQNALKAVETVIDDPKGRYQYNQTQPGGEGFASFNITPSVSGTSEAARRRSYIRAKVEGGGNAAISTFQLIPAAILKQTADSFYINKRLTIPPIADEISKLYGGNVSPITVLNEQINLYNRTATNKLKPITVVNAGGGDAGAPMSPRMREIMRQLQYMPTRETVNRVSMISGSAPKYVRQGPEGFQDVMSMVVTMGHPHPALAAAQWALETGYGRSQLATGQNNLFGFRSYDPKSNGWRAYNSHSESVKAYVENITKNPRYAAVLKAQTPRQAAIAVGAAGYAGGEASYPNKLIRVMRENGINPDVPYTNPTGNVWHTPGVANTKLTNAIGKQLLSQMQKTSGFGSQESFRRKPHEGNDYAVVQGSRMSLKQPARVIDVISERDPNHGGYGGMVEIEFPDGARARVAHLSKVKVKPGDVIPAKKVFALTGGAPGTPGAGRSTGPHVHLEMLTTARGRNETTKGKADPTAIAPRFYIDS